MIPGQESVDHIPARGACDHRGDWKIDSTFSAPSLYFLSPLLFCLSSCETLVGVPLAESTTEFFDSPLKDCSEESLGAPTEISDCLDFNDGVTGSVEPREGEAVSRAAVLEVVESVADVEFDIVFELVLALAVLVGERCRRNSFGFLRNVRPGLRPLRYFSAGVGDSEASGEPTKSLSFEMPEIFLPFVRRGVDLRNTASL